MQAAATDKHTRKPHTNVRWKIGILMWLAISINYLDRANLSAASGDIMKALNINNAEMGIVMSAFFWSYMVFQIPSGWLADKVGHRISMALAVGWWSISTALTGLAHGFGSLIGLRMLLGVGEAGAAPSNSGIAARWFPDRERGRISAFYDTGTKVGTAIAMPLIVWIISHWGWQASFAASGTLGIVWVLIWIWYYNDPEKQKYVSKEELHYIRSGQKKQDGLDKEQPMKWYQLLKFRNVWAICFGFFALNYSIFFFITWFPNYLEQERGMAAMSMGFTAMIPPLAGIVGELIGGWVTDYLYFTRGKSITFSRKFNLVLGMLVGTVILFAGLTKSTAISVALLSLSYAGLAFAAPALWSIPGDMAPKNMSSTLGGIENTASNIGGVLSPIITGFVVSATGSFVSALIVSGLVTLLGAIAFAFWLGKIEPLTLKKHDVAKA
ncbi:MFS transporter [Lacticaseibacillus baoqingensis]|uniref:MFS transporter n=1 Tax=Lacticaseibacillus baoqingensis TaxID=2486013 RepID=A0ABW4E5W6_9LACO